MTVCYAPCPVVFDLDGTLIDSAPDIHAAVNAVLRDEGVQPLTLDRVRGFIGGGVEVLWHRIIEATGLPQTRYRDLLAAFMARYRRSTSLTRFYPGVLDALNVLADRGHPMGICTNKPADPTQAVLAHMGIAEYFATVVAGDSLPQHKPHPAPLRMALQALGAAPENPKAIYVGDSEVDAETAAAVPVPLMLFTGGYRHTPLEQLPHHAAFDDFSALPALIEQMVTA
ncbi:phosphoglycolate phosphatase [Paracoccus tegillarcae]|uniref:Phosphoglycolate phosphatase n=1 Tax=Paracoccus tegillarcae TaxID=1529068 RepID=A0A2K9EIF3_9RHOB|nr:phosphoglycolate phosphatase [Paracoccus tegillarcae]AUH34763.1 phosphoglycolate phosphatase [Paracoccus tegillarcae]